MNKALVVIHGFNSSSTSFNYILDKLDWDGEVVRVNYNSHQPLADSVAQVQSQLPADKKLTLIGHSLGGVIALLLAHHAPENIKQVITISSPVGGSKAASFARWMPWAPPVMSDITPSSQLIKIAKGRPSVPVAGVITTGGGLGLTNEANDSIVTVASQKAVPGKKAELKANHFEVLMHPTTIRYLEHFMGIKELK